MEALIAIDGPAASGKSSVAKGLAHKLGFLFVSSGHFYRAVAWLSKQHHLDFSNPSATLILSGLRETNIDGSLHLFFEAKDLSEYLNDPEVNAAVSPLAAIPAIRTFVTTRLHALASSHNLVIEGRDIGSIVFPETPWKFYLDASLEERTRRRAQENSFDAIAERDKRDATRNLAPLIIPEGAIVIDTTNLNIEEVIEKILECIKK